MPDVLQVEDYTCGPASLRAVLAAFRMPTVAELRIAQLAKTTPEAGTKIHDLADAATAIGLEADVRSHMTVDDLKVALSSGALVVVDYQAWREDTSKPWRDHWGDGHYAVVVGVTDSDVILEDPWMLGAVDRMPRDEFVDRWHGDENKPGKRLMQGGLVLRPPEALQARG